VPSILTRAMSRRSLPWLAALSAMALTQAQLLCRTPEECGTFTEGVNCGAEGGSLTIADDATLCLGFQPSNGSAADGGKALFRVTVDSFSLLRVDTLRTLMGAAWSPMKEKYSAMWVGLNGRRTIGQQRGVVTAAGVCNATEGLEGSTCYGWTQHNKPVITEDFELASGLTVIVHLDHGRVNRLVWDSSCNLCPSRKQDVVCMWDRTDIACVDGRCSDCYAKLPPGGCTRDSEVCAPSVYIAWVGTDAKGSPLLSGGSVLSRFAQGSVAGIGNQLYDDVRNLEDDFSGR